jgi:hypothetical protein
MPKGNLKIVARASKRSYRARGALARTASAMANGSKPASAAFERPVWDEQTGQLCWKGQIVLALAKRTHSERAILAGFERYEWRWAIPDPIDRGAIGDPTQERRHAIHNLKHHQKVQSRTEIIRFFSFDRCFVGWCDAQWLAPTRKKPQAPA